MRRAVELAWRGQGHVEPNPMVGCVFTDADGAVIGEGYHQQFGGPHAEVVALDSLAVGVTPHTAHVTLEPCSHHGKTPPCADALIQAGVQRVVVGIEDPNPAVAGKGIARMREAGIEVTIGEGSELATHQLAPYLKGVQQGQPWVIAKWAMTLDGKIATTTGNSQWISNEASRAVVHQIRGRVDGIAVGLETALQDDPLLTARPAGPRVAGRVVFDRKARLPLNGKLVQTIGDAAVIVVAGVDAAASQVAALTSAGCQVIQIADGEPEPFVGSALTQLHELGMTNLLVEGGSELFGSFMTGGHIDEVHAFIAPTLVGGQHAKSPIAGQGVSRIIDGTKLSGMNVEKLGDNIYVSGRVVREG